MPLNIEQVKILWLDLEGVGRCNLGKSISEKNPHKNDAAGVDHPQSGRTDIHPQVVDVAMRRFQIDIVDWPVQRLEPNMVDESTIVVALLQEVSRIPDFVFEQSLDVFHAPIPDPADNLDNMLEHTATQIAHIYWLLAYLLDQQPEQVGNSRNEQGRVIPRDLTRFEPINIDPEHMLANVFLNSSSAAITPGSAIEDRHPAGEIPTFGSRNPNTSHRSFFDGPDEMIFQSSRKFFDL